MWFENGLRRTSRRRGSLRLESFLRKAKASPARYSRPRDPHPSPLPLHMQSSCVVGFLKGEGRITLEGRGSFAPPALQASRPLTTQPDLNGTGTQLNRGGGGSWGMGGTELPLPPWKTLPSPCQRFQSSSMRSMQGEPLGGASRGAGGGGGKHLALCGAPRHDRGRKPK